MKRYNDFQSTGMWRFYARRNLQRQILVREKTPCAYLERALVRFRRFGIMEKGSHLKRGIKAPLHTLGRVDTLPLGQQHKQDNFANHNQNE